MRHSEEIMLEMKITVGSMPVITPSQGCPDKPHLMMIRDMELIVLDRFWE